MVVYQGLLDRRLEFYFAPRFALFTVTSEELVITVTEQWRTRCYTVSMRLELAFLPSFLAS